MYQKNEGMLDRLIRVILGEVFFILAWFWLGGSFQTIAYILSAVMLITAITGFCGLYKIFGINTNNNKKYSKVIWSIFAILFLAVAIVGSYYSSFFTKKLFLEDYNVMNNYYKQTLFNTGQDNRLESIANYDKLVIEYRNFTDKYSNYHPQVIAKDKNFNSDLVKVKNIIAGLKNEVYVGDLKDSHLSFEEIRPIFQC